MTGGSNKTGGRRSFGKGRRSGQGQQNTPRFYGATAALKGVMFDTGVDRQAETYIKNLKRIADYVGANMKHHGADVRIVVENLADPILEEPEDPADDATRTQVRMWEKQVDCYIKRLETLNENKKTLFSIILGQCTEGMKYKLAGEEEWEITKQNFDSIGLLKTLKNIMYSFGTRKDLAHALHDASMEWYGLRQRQGENNNSYQERFISVTEMMLEQNKNFGVFSELIQECFPANTEITPEMISEKKEEARDRYIATAYILRSDRTRYQELINRLMNSTTVGGASEYPTSLPEAVHIMDEFKGTRTPTGAGRGDVMTFAQTAETMTTTTKSSGKNAGRSGFRENQTDGQSTSGNTNSQVIPGNNGRVFDHIQCHRCNQMGHYASNCPATDEELPSIRNEEANATTTNVEEVENANDNDDSPTEEIQDESKYSFFAHMNYGLVTSTLIECGRDGNENSMVEQMCYNNSASN